ncbi:MAG TPA: hypothetical protein VFK69_02070 [Candidatus Eisenbacteria bacterium]|nr:hypothetical protein [Candidatus Eisenbacteria bacterium]
MTIQADIVVTPPAEPESGRTRSAWMEFRPSVETVEIALKPPKTVDEIAVGHLLDPELRVYTPFLVRFASEGSHAIAEAPAFNEFGFGEDRSVALRDLQRAIGQLFHTLTKEPDRLGPDLDVVRQALLAHVRPR